MVKVLRVLSGQKFTLAIVTLICVSSDRVPRGQMIICPLGVYNLW